MKLLVLIVFVLFGCYDRVIPNKNVVVKSIEKVWSDNYCYYECSFVNKSMLYSDDGSNGYSAFEDICGKFQIGDTVHVEIVKSSKEIKLEK